jgi:uncharacterized iron-regulated membrane protein
MSRRSPWSVLAPSHRRWALLALVPALWLAVTGALLGLKPTLAFLGDGVDVPPATAALPLEAILENVDRAVGRGRVESVHPPARGDGAYRVVLRSDSSGSRQVALFHPFTGAWLGLRSAREEDFWKLLYRLHRGKVLELPGQLLVTLGALALFVVAWSGLRLLRARRATGTVATGRRRWHTWAGAGATLVLLPVWLTGIPLNFQAPLAAWLDPVPPAAMTVPDRPLRWSQLLAHVETGGAAWEGIYFPRRHGEPYQFFAKDGARRYVDASTGQLLLARDRTRSGATGLLAWLYPIHGGEALGAFGRWLVVLGAVLLVAVAWTGLRLPGGLAAWRKALGSVARALGRVAAALTPPLESARRGA